MKKMFAVLGVLSVAAAASTASAQGMGGMKMDDNFKPVTQQGPTPPGWTLRPDKPADKPESVNFVTMGTGMHVTSGMTPAIYWNPANTASGAYTLSVTFGVRSIPLHDAVGLVWGGADLSGDKQSYDYFLIYGDGQFAVKHRSGAAVHDVIAKTKNAAIKAADKDGGSASNNVAVKVAADSVRMFVNDVQVAAVDAKNPMMPNAGIYGVRVNHGISVHIANLAKN
jgi:hypothetical protein